MHITGERHDGRLAVPSDVRERLDDDYEDATLQVGAELANYTDDDRSRHTTRGTLHDPDGSVVATFSESAVVEAGGTVVTLEQAVADPVKWSAEHPNLYYLTLELVPEGRDGNPSEVLLEKVGFREYEAERGEASAAWTVNGEPVNIGGVNRHETDPETGRRVPIETMREDLELMKRFNTNSLRTSH